MYASKSSYIHLIGSMHTPHPFQRVAIDHCLEGFRSSPPRSRTLYSSPTGSGKSLIQCYVQRELPECWIISPSWDILDGYLDKLGLPSAECEQDYTSRRLCTPVTYRNRLLAGELPQPSHLIFDEGHHCEADTWKMVELLSGLCPAAAFSATAYRGSPRSTRELHETWGAPVQILSFTEAVSMGIISCPTFTVLPLVDDDIVEVQGGDFAITSIDSVTVDRLGDVAEHSKQWHSGGHWDRATVYALPSTACCIRLQQELLKRGLPCVVVNANTSRDERRGAFEAVKARIVALLHINILGEGVDLPLRRCVDLAPTLSPVRWVQSDVGRITRPVAPGEAAPEYICCNRNLERHCYALQGAVPIASVAASERVFGPTSRPHSRALGLEAIGRFKPVSLRLLSGANAFMYALSVVVDTVVVDYAVLVHPTQEPVWSTRVHQVRADGTRDWGTWRRCEAPNDLRGFSSKPGRELSEKQVRWWSRSAASHGLDPEQTVNAKNFTALPVLNDLGLRLT